MSAQLAPNRVAPSKSDYAYTLVPCRCIFLEDLGGECGLVDDMENVVANLYAAGLLRNGMVLIYRGFNDQIDEVRHDNGKFVGFWSLQTRQSGGTTT